MFNLASCSHKHMCARLAQRKFQFGWKSNLAIWLFLQSGQSGEKSNLAIWLFTQSGQSGWRSNLANLAIYSTWSIWQYMQSGQPVYPSNLANLARTSINFQSGNLAKNQSGNLAKNPIWQMMEKDEPKHMAAGRLAPISLNPSFRIKIFALGLEV